MGSIHLKSAVIQKFRLARGFTMFFAVGAIGTAHSTSEEWRHFSFAQFVIFVRSKEDKLALRLQERTCSSKDTIKHLTRLRRTS